MSGRPIRVWDHDFKEEDIGDVRPRDVIVYSGGDGELDTYLVVNRIESGIVHGMIATLLETNRVPVEDIVSACALSDS